jgi:hypothetical protein
VRRAFYCVLPFIFSSEKVGQVGQSRIPTNGQRIRGVDVMTSDSASEIKRALQPGGHLWFMRLVDDLVEIDRRYGLIENKLLAVDYGLDRPEFAALPHSEQLYWVNDAVQRAGTRRVQR